MNSADGQRRDGDDGTAEDGCDAPGEASCAAKPARWAGPLRGG